MSEGEETKNKSRRSPATLRRLLAYLRPHRGLFIPAALALVVTACLSLGFPYFMSELVGGARDGGELDVAHVSANVNRIAITLAILLAIQAAVAFFRVIWLNKAGERAIADLRRDTYGHLVRLPMTYFGENRVGELSSRMSADLTTLRDTLLQTFPQLVRQSVMLIGGLIFIFFSSVKLSLFMLACLPVVVLLVAFFGRKVRNFTRVAQDELASSQVVVEETLQGIESVKAFHNEPNEETRYGNALSRYIHAVIKGVHYRAAFISFIIFVLFGTITLVMWYGARMLADGAIGTTEFTRFILFSIFIGASLGSLPEIIANFSKAMGASDRICEILDEDMEEANPEGISEGRLAGAVEVRDLHFAYPSREDVTVLDGLGFSCQPGERIALVGGSGAGKSTVINLLLQFFKPASGEVLFDGKPASAYSLSHLRSQMALVPQEVLLFGGSILDNIRYGRPDATDEEIREAARKANAHDFIAEFPEGYETLVGDRGLKLSGGQRQRIAIARAVLADPAILILDEATSSLDSESEHLVQEALDQLMEGRTSIIIAHRLATVRDADRILVLRDGKVAESGSHDELNAQADSIYRMLSQLQFG